ncbi:MAG TPA: hypothetical protein DEB40_08985 [Elusimicrobia bacterium]|nr:hypothetical protein [Elusimicrobiota bacterium]HBT61862.1 hypothetical protein [Elusimicrobiota bacterium]
MRLKLFLRVLCLQAGWSFERMQGLGFAYCVDPWLKQCYAGRAGERRAAQLRHQEYFNTQPYMASLVLGMVCALEEEAAAIEGAQRTEKLDRLRALKTAAAAALAGLGDALFWGTLRPVCAALALASAWICSGSPEEAVVLAAAVYLVSFNVPVLYMRWRFLGQGYRWKEQIAVNLKDWSGQGRIRALRLGGMALALAAAVVLLRDTVPWQRPVGILAMAAAVGLRALRVSSYRLYAATILIGVLASWTGWL